MEGEAEYAQTDKKTALSAVRFISEMTCPTTIHEFGIDKDGWAASHCQIGGVNAASAVLLDWLDKTLIKKPVALCGSRKKIDFEIASQSALAKTFTSNKDQATEKVRHDWSMVKKYHGCKELDRLLESMPDNIVSSIA